MFDPTSRYYNLPTGTMTVLDDAGQPRLVKYVRRRFIPQQTGQTLVEHRVRQNERLDNITTTYLGDPLQFWRVCDANEVLAPNELTAEVGSVIRIALPNL